VAIFQPVTHQQVLEAIPTKTRRRRPWVALGGVALLFIVLLAVVAILESPVPTPACRLRCPPPPPPSAGHSTNPGPPKSFIASAAQSARPVQLSLYRSSAYGFTVQWDPLGLPPASQTTDKGVQWKLVDQNRNEFVVVLWGVPARGRGPTQIISDVAASAFPDFHRVYDIPEAEVGYVTGAGTVYDGSATPADGRAYHARIAIEAAIHGGLGVVALEEGPFTKDTGSGFADPAQVPDSQGMDQLANTVTWAGEPPQ